MLTFLSGALIGAIAGALMPDMVHRAIRRALKAGVIVYAKLRRATVSVREDFQDIRAEVYAELESGESDVPRLITKSSSEADEPRVKKLS